MNSSRSGSGQRLSEFIKEWKTHYAEKYGLTSNSLGPMVGVISDGVGSFSLEHLAAHPDYIERWLNRMQTERKWSENSWNRYYELLHSLFNRAIRWKRLKVEPDAHDRQESRSEAEVRTFALKRTSRIACSPHVTSSIGLSTNRTASC